VKSYSVHFSFTQHFDFPAEAAYAWCTDYQRDDLGLMGAKGERKVKWVNEDTAILSDEFHSGGQTSSGRKLIRLYPERFSWVNTRISRVGRHSQFLYEVRPEKGGSRLYFTGSQVLVAEKAPSRAKTQSIAKDLARENSSIWRNLAKAMARDLGAAQRSIAL
jgi:hypothetical protein